MSFREKPFWSMKFSDRNSPIFLYSSRSIETGENSPGRIDPLELELNHQSQLTQVKRLRGALERAVNGGFSAVTIRWVGWLERCNTKVVVITVWVLNQK